MQDLDSRVNVSAEGNVRIVEFADRKILDEVNIMQIGRQLESLVEDADKPDILLDFSNVEHMSSSALGVLITLHKHIRQKNGQLRLCCVGSDIYEIFAITRLDEIFQMFDSRPEAMKSFEQTYPTGGQTKTAGTYIGRQNGNSIRLDSRQRR